MSFAKFTAQVTRENSDIVGLPVYASRLFRFSSFYVVAPDHHRKASVAFRLDQPVPPELKLLLLRLRLRRGAAGYHEHKR